MLINILFVTTAILAATVIVLAFLLTRKGQATQPGLEKIVADLDRLDRMLREEAARGRDEAALRGKEQREELAAALRGFGEVVMARVSEGGDAQKKHLELFASQLMGRVVEVGRLQKTQMDIFSEQLNKLMAANETRQERLRETVEERLRYLQEENGRKLEQMRATVDEKLHDTLEKRLGESFKLVSDRLEMVHKGLGEMQTLATGVGDLKRVLLNVKTRGTFGEIQLHALLEQILTPEQYEANVATKMGSNNRVEFAIRLPGKDNEKEAVWLPVDAKFPQEDYLRLLDAQEHACAPDIEEAAKQLERAVRESAKTISAKYLDPPNTTDFAIMFLPTEGLYAEVLRRPGLFELLQREYKVVVTGPTTLAALLNSLQMGFRTLAIEKRSSEVWALLSAVKTEFGKFGVVLEKTKKKLLEVGHTIDDAAVRTRAIERKLRDVQALPSVEAAELLGEEFGGDLPEVAAGLPPDSQQRPAGVR